jgi:hypothetical protein
MKKNVNINFLNSILKSDFLLLNNHNKNNPLGFSISILDLPQVLSSLKQLVRLLQYTKSKNNSFLYIVVENKNNFILLKNLFKDFSNRIIIKSTFDYELQLQSADLKMCFILEVNLKSKFIIRRLFKNNFFIINCLN